LTVSLDTLRPERFLELTRRDEHALVLKGIAAAGAAGFGGLKLDTVVLRGVNEDELSDLVRYGERVSAEVRFIEYMDVAGATRWSSQDVVPREEILGRIEAELGPAQPLGGRGSSPAERFQLASGTTFGIIASTTRPFCRACDRSRLTADGMWYLCLYARVGKDLRNLLRRGAPREEIAAAIAEVWRAREDRGAELRRESAKRTAFASPLELRADPHLEMHTRGG
jgi:cyclic pyranopterin phosphate synthase